MTETERVVERGGESGSSDDGRGRMAEVNKFSFRGNIERESFRADVSKTA